MGFKNYDYIENANPKKYKEIMFDNVKESEHQRIKAMLRSALMPKLDSRISTGYGKSGAGKTTGLTILSGLLGEYSLNVDLSKLLEDRFLTAKTKGKTNRRKSNFWKRISSRRYWVWEHSNNWRRD